MLGMVVPTYDPTTWRQKQEDCFMLQASLSYTMRSRPAWATERNKKRTPPPQKKKSF